MFLAGDIRMAKKSFLLIVSIMYSLNCPVSADGERDFYRGNYGPDADYILSGGLIKDLPPAIPMPVDYEGAGFAADRLSPVPAPGVHPRVIMSPSDVARMKKLVRMGDKAPRFFRIHLEALKRNKGWEIPPNYAYHNNPFGQDGNIAGWALLALLTDDRQLGRKAAQETVKHALFMEPRIDILNTCEAAKHFKQVSYDFVRTSLRFGPFTYTQAYYDGGKERIAALTKKHGVELAHTGDWTGSYYSLGWEYDYAYNFMTEAERDIVRRVVSKATYGKYDTGMAIPGHMYINNHMSSGANWIPLALAIEGEEGYDERILPIALWSLQNKLTYDLSSDGITYENTKGFIPVLAVLACARRQGADDPENLLRHSHLVARAYSNVQHARKLYNRYIGRHRYRKDTPRLQEVKSGLDEPRYWRASGGSGSGGHLEFWYVLKYFYPDNEMVDFVYNVKNSEFNADLYQGKEGEMYNSRLHYSWFHLPALSMLTASHDTDYHKLDSLEQFEDLPKFWFDSERGMVSMRNGWDQDAMLVHMENRIDQYYAGHETPQHGDFQIWADGIPWSPNLGAYRDASYRAMVTVDGLAGVYSPVSGDWMTAHDTPEAATAVAEMTTSYQWRKLAKLLHLDHPALEQAPLKMARWAEAAYKQDRFTELPYLPKIKEHYDGFAHLDYGPWHGETRVCERYVKWNDPLRHVFRTLHVARGDKPYLLVMDDLDKDGKEHQYDWRMPVIGDAYVYCVNPAPQNRHLELNTEGAIGTDIILALADDKAQRAPGTVWGTVYPKMKPQPKKGDPMLLVRVLWRNTNYPYPVPNVQRYWDYNMISVPAYSKSPEYRILIFPHRFGDKLPVTIWSDDRGQLTVKIGGNVDVYDFDKTDRQRTVFTMSRNGKKTTDSKATPPKPMLQEKGKWTVDQNRPQWRQPRIVVGSAKVAFASPAPGAEIYYTLDGSKPGKDSPAYYGPITIDASCTLKARTYQADWRGGPDDWSEVASFEFAKRPPAPAATTTAPVPGLVAQGCEIKTTMFDRKGFVQGSKNSLPDVTRYEPLISTVTDGFDIPAMESKEPRQRMMKAFYRFAGYFDARETGVYYFEVESCGPVDFKVGGRQVILVNQQYGLSYKKRYGEVALARGQHKLRLVVCDTMFWKGDLEEPYEINVAVKAPGFETYAAIDTSQLSCDAPFALAGTLEDVKPLAIEINAATEGLNFRYSLAKLVTGKEIIDKRIQLPQGERVIRVDEPGHYVLTVAACRNGKQVGTSVTRELMLHRQYPGMQTEVVPGVTQSKYDRLDFFAWQTDMQPAAASEASKIPMDGLPPKYFDVAGATPYSSAAVGRMLANDSHRKLIAYDGFLRIARDGLYEFKLLASKKNAGQLIIHDQVVVRQQVSASKAPPKIWLGGGLHPFTYQIALGQAVFLMRHSDDAAFQKAGVAALARPATADVFVDGEKEASNSREIFRPVSVALASPIEGAGILYSLDGSRPATSYRRPLSIHRTSTLKTQLAVDGEPVGAPRAVEFTLSTVPTAGLIAHLTCESIENGQTPVLHGKGAAAVVEGGQVIDGKNGKALGMYDRDARIVVRGLQTHEDESTIACWVKFKDRPQDIGIWGKVANTWPEHYIFRLRGSRLVAEWQRGIGMVDVNVDRKQVQPGRWFHIAATFGKENAVYFNGELLKTVHSQNMPKRSSNGLADNGEIMSCDNEPTAVDDYRIYNRVLSPAEIATLYREQANE